MKRFKTVIVCLLASVLLVCGCFTGCKSDDAAYAAAPAMSYRINNPIRNIGSPQKLYSYRDNLTYEIQYPKIGNANIDNILFSQISQKADEFTAQYSGYTPTDKTARAELYATYQSYTYGDNSVSIEMQYRQKDPITGKSTETVQTFVFFQDTLLSAQDVFDMSQWPVVADAVELAFSSSDTYRDAVNHEHVHSALHNQYETCSHFVLDGESVRFFFDKGALFPDSFGVVSVCISKDQIANCFSSSAPKPFQPELTGAQLAVQQGKPIIALTFDDGPKPETTNLILNQLEQFGAHATFFVIGNRAEQHPDILQREVQLGCEIGNHSYSHTSFAQLPAEQIHQEIDKTNDIVRAATNTTPALIRPPYGAVNQHVYDNVDAPLVLWCIDTLDWKTQNSDSTIYEVLSKIQDGDIILMHDIQDSTANAVQELVPELIRRGYYLATVSEMFQAKGIPMENGQKYRAAHPPSPQ